MCKHLKVDPETPWQDLPRKARDVFLDGLGAKKIRVDYHTLDGRDTHWFTTFSGLRKIMFDKYSESTSEAVRARLERYIREVPCDACNGARLKPEILAVTVGGKSIYDVCQMSAADSLAFFEGLELEGQALKIAGPIVKEILGEKWLTNKWFRLGTSRLANLLLSEIEGKETNIF